MTGPGPSRITLSKDGGRWLLLRDRGGQARPIVAAATTQKAAVEALGRVAAAALDHIDDDPRAARIAELERRVGELDWRHKDHAWLQGQYERLRAEVDDLRRVLAWALRDAYGDDTSHIPVGSLAYMALYMASTNAGGMPPEGHFARWAGASARLEAERQEPGP